MIEKLARNRIWIQTNWQQVIVKLLGLIRLILENSAVPHDSFSPAIGMRKKS